MKKSKMRSEASSSGGGGGCNVRGESVVMDLGHRRSSCGYCKSDGRTSISHGLWAYSLTVDDYQDLLDRGWRRSGCFLYKPEMDKTCCPSYTIRLKAGDFAPSKEQLRVYRRMQRFLDGMLDMEKPLKCVGSPNASGVTESSSHVGVSSSVTDDLHCKDKEADRAEQFLCNLSDQINSAVSKCVESGELPSNVQFPKAVVKIVSQSKRKLLAEGSEDLLCTCNIPFIISSALRRAKSAEKKADHVITRRDNGEDITISPSSVAEMLVNSLNQLVKASGLSVRACNGHINVYSTSLKVSLNGDVQVVSIPEKSANARASKSSCQKNSECPSLVRRKFELRLKSSNFDPEEYALYRKYQLKVHNDTPDHVTESSYRRFLVDTPLVFVSPTGDSSSPPSGFGSFHQQYIIDGQLVAVGVVDILPKCLSSKYLFWDPDYAFLSLGKYSALQEIDWVKENQIHCPSLQYYYLGYYIHSCRKMRYKAAYHPSELLCPLRYQWVPFDVARPLLDRRKYVVLSDFSDSQKGASSISFLSESVMEQDDIGPDGSNDILIDGDEEMDDVESSEDELDLEASDFVSLGTENGHDVANILLGLKGSRVRYKDVERAVGPSRRKYLEAQLRRYQSVVGVELSERLIYVLG